MTRTKIVECVPNFSEGQRQNVIDAISQAIRDTPGVSLLGVDAGASTNRTVYTFVGSPDDVIEGALQAARCAFKLIDMSKQKGEHPRLGALDVCPFIPVQGVEMEECVYCARKFGEKLASELNVPVYLYGYASRHEYRRSVPQIRAGEYEGIAEKIKLTEWKPDFGPAQFVPSWGATMSGARKFLIAYNINLIATKEQSHRIALNIREDGRGKDHPGLFKKIQAVGWWLEEENIAQVSVNVLDNDVTPMHIVYEEVVKQAKELKLPVTGSQIVGLVPLKALLEAADYYIQKENLFVLEESQKVHLVINRLGLNTLGGFDPKERVVEYMLPDNNMGPLVKKTVFDFVTTVGARTPAPGGGSVAATVAALGAALGAMTGKMTYGRRQWELHDAHMRRLIPNVHHTMLELIPMVDADTGAYNDYVAAMKLPKSTPEEEAIRESALQAGLLKAIQVPLNVARLVSGVWPTIIELATIINIGARADLQVGARCLETGVWGAYYNVMINCGELRDVDYKERVIVEIEEHRTRATKACNDVLRLLEERTT